MVYFINIPYQLVITGFLNHQRYHSTHLAFFRWQGGYIRFDVSCFKQTNLNTVGCRCCEYPRAASEGKGSRNAGFAVNCPAKTQRSFLPKKSWPTKNITWFWKKNGRNKTIKTCNERLEWRVTELPLKFQLHAPKFTEDRINPSGARCCMELSQMPSLLEGESIWWLDVPKFLFIYLKSEKKNTYSPEI